MLERDANDLELVDDRSFDRRKSLAINDVPHIEVGTLYWLLPCWINWNLKILHRSFFHALLIRFVLVLKLWSGAGIDLIVVRNVDLHLLLLRVVLRMSSGAITVMARIGLDARLKS